MPGYTLSRKAESDLKDIYKYTYREYGEEQADRYLSALEEAFILLSETPLICRKREEFVPPVRIHPCKKHLIIYTRQDSN
jgi:toxin ParE1/3/4